MTEINTKIQSFNFKRSIDTSDVRGNFVFSNDADDFKGDLSSTVEIDKQVDVSAGYTTGGDASALIFSGLISSARGLFDAETFSARTNATVISAFKNYRKTRIITTEFRYQTGQYILNYLIALTGWDYYDFSECSGKTFNSLRINGDNLAEAMMDIAEACQCELGWHGHTLKAYPFLTEFGTNDYEYSIHDVNSISIGHKPDISAVNTLEMKGMLGSPQNASELKHVLIYTGDFYYSTLVNQYTVGDLRYYTLWMDFERGPAVDVSFKITNYSGQATAEPLLLDEDKATIRIARDLTAIDDEDGYPDNSFTIEAWGFLYRDPEYRQVNTKVVDTHLLALYNNVKMERTYTNIYVNTVADLKAIGNFELLRSFMQFNMVTATLPHNNTLELNDIIEVCKDDRSYKIVVREIGTKFDARDYSLIDTVRGWLVNTGTVDESSDPTGIYDDNLKQKFTFNVIDSSGNNVVDSSGNQVIASGIF